MYRSNQSQISSQEGRRSRASKGLRLENDAIRYPTEGIDVVLRGRSLKNMTNHLLRQPNGCEARRCTARRDCNFILSRAGFEVISRDVCTNM